MGEPQPSVKMGKPIESELYNEYVVDNIVVYVKNDVQTKNDELKIKYTKLLWNEQLVVEGMAF